MRCLVVTRRPIPTATVVAGMNSTSAFGAITRRWWVIVLLIVAGAVIGALPQPERVEEQVQTFSATHTLVLNDEILTQQVGASISPNQVPLFVSTGEVPARAAQVVGFDGNAATLASQVTSLFDPLTGALTITTAQDSADRSEAVANAFADELNSYLAERQDVIYEQRLTAASERLSELETDLNAVTLELAGEPESPTLLARQTAVSRLYSVAFEQSAELEATPPVVSFTSLQRAQAVDITDSGIGAPTSRSSRALLGMIVGAAVGLGVALALGQFDRRLRTREQAEEVMDLRARVMIPKVRDIERDQLIVTRGRHDPLSDAYRTVRNVVGFVQGSAVVEGRARITLVVSPGPSDGKTSLAVNLAAAMAESGQRTILMNTDFRRPRLSSTLGAAVSTPLPFMLEDLDQLDARTLLTKTGRDRLAFMDLSSIDGSAGELMRASIDKLPGMTELADSIVIDTSPVGATAEVLELIPYADVIVVVGRVGSTQIAAAQRTMAILRDLATAPMVLVLGGVKMDRANYYDYTDRKGASGASAKWRRRSKPDEVSTEPARDLEPVE